MRAEKRAGGEERRETNSETEEGAKEGERREGERQKERGVEERSPGGEEPEEEKREQKSRVWNKNVETAVGSRRVTDPTASDKGRVKRNDEDGDRRKKRKIGRSTRAETGCTLSPLRGRRAKGEARVGEKSSEMKQQQQQQQQPAASQQSHRG